MSKFKPRKLNLSDERKDEVIEKLVQIAQSVDGKPMKKTASTLPQEARDRITEGLLKDPTGRGLKRIAYAKSTLGSKVMA